MSRYLIGYLVFILFLFSGNIMAAKTGEVSEMGQMESALLQEQMQKIAAEGTAKTSPALPTTQKEQAAGEKKVNISYPLAIEAHGTDPIGQKLVFLLKENFNKSSFFVPATKKEKRILLRVNTLNEFPGRLGLSAVYVFSWLFSESEETIPYFLDNTIGIVDSSQLEKCAQQILIHTTEVMEHFHYLF